MVANYLAHHFIQRSFLDIHGQRVIRIFNTETLLWRLRRFRSLLDKFHHMNRTAIYRVIVTVRMQRGFQGESSPSIFIEKAVLVVFSA